MVTISKAENIDSINSTTYLILSLGDIYLKDYLNEIKKRMKMRHKISIRPVIQGASFGAPEVLWW